MLNSIDDMDLKVLNVGNIKYGLAEVHPIKEV